jgi:uroporphyrin-III C-methyltransferase
MKAKKGKVYLVGAGPGDPDLITIKGKTLLKKADVILYDKLASETLLKSAKKSTRLINVGKRSGKHIVPQPRINELLVHWAGQVKTVVRLKGGDPFILGRGGEEAEYLAKHKIKFEIVPGVSAISGAPAYAGIPLTHRYIADNFAVATGHTQVEKSTRKLSVPRADTLVYLMGVRNLPNILKALFKAGYKENMPIALIQQGTTKQQKTITGTLKNILVRAKKAAVKPPALIIVGNVVKLKKKIGWFE